MPYSRRFYPGRRMGGRFGPNRRVPARQVLLSTFSANSVANTGTPLNGFIDTNLQTDFPQLAEAPYYLKSLHYWVTFGNQTVAANVAPCVDVLGFLLDPASATTAGQDPLAATGRVRPFLSLCSAGFPFLANPPAGPVTASQVIERYHYYRKPVKVRSTDHIWFIHSGRSFGGVQSLAADFFVRMQIIVP